MGYSAAGYLRRNPQQRNKAVARSKPALSLSPDLSEGPQVHPIA
jgi:hypothetical protein